MMNIWIYDRNAQGETSTQLIPPPLLLVPCNPYFTFLLTPPLPHHLDPYPPIDSVGFKLTMEGKIINEFKDLIDSVHIIFGISPLMQG